MAEGQIAAQLRGAAVRSTSTLRKYLFGLVIVLGFEAEGDRINEVMPMRSEAFE
jgi:hypothetical protein